MTSRFPPIERLPGPPRITCTPDIQGGDPCIDGTRIQAWQILACWNGGDTEDEIYEAYPRAPFGTIELVIEWAKANDLAVTVPYRRVPVARTG